MIVCVEKLEKIWNVPKVAKLKNALVVLIILVHIWKNGVNGQIVQ